MSTCTRFCTSTAWALLFGFLAQSCLGVARAQGVVLGDVGKVQKSAEICADEAQPPAVRVASCTLVMRQAVLTNAAHAKILDDRANALSALGKRDEAIGDFTRAIELDPDDLPAYSGRAFLYLATNRTNLAALDLSHVIQAQPASQGESAAQTALAFYNRGVAYERSGELGKALDDYRNAVRLMPSFAPARAALGKLLKAQDPDAALSQLTAAVRLDPESPAIRSRATLNLSLNRPEQALRDLNQIIARNGSDSGAYLDRGVVNQQLGNLKDAIADYSRSVELAPSAAGYFDRASVFESLQEPEKALADFTAALHVDPAYVPALLGRAEENYARGELAASLDDYTRVIQAQPNNATAYFKRGNVNLDLGKVAAASSDYSESLRLEPDQPEVLYSRALAAERMGHLKDADGDRRRAQELDHSSHE